jgi:hypothetical protein
MEQEQKDRTEEHAVMAKRLLRIEERLDLIESGGAAAPLIHPAWPFALGCAAIVSGYLGMGVPRHPYQYLFAGLLLLLAYHRHFLRRGTGWWQWPLAVVNAANLVLFFLIVLGGGVRHPFSWIKTPAVVKQAPPEGGAWYNKLVPEYDLQWYAVPGVSDWGFDLTKVQVFLLIATLAGVLFRFQGFASVTALALLIVSIPVYLSFTWDWVVPFLIFGSISLYLQTAPPAVLRDHGRR